MSRCGIFTLLFISAFVSALNSTVASTSEIKTLLEDGVAPPSKAQCVMYDECGKSPVNPDLNTNCVYNGPPKKLNYSESLETLKSLCPELVEKYGDELCCSAAQINTLQQNLGLPQGIIGRCPGCFYNFRQLICELACGQMQSQFLNVTKTKKDNDTSRMLLLKID